MFSVGIDLNIQSVFPAGCRAGELALFAEEEPPRCVGQLLAPLGSAGRRSWWWYKNLLMPYTETKV